MSDKDTVVLVCAPVSGRPLLIEDNLTGRCDTCQTPVQFRPHAPKNRVLRCLPCAADQLFPGDTVEITEQMLADLEEYFKAYKRRHSQ